MAGALAAVYTPCGAASGTVGSASSGTRAYAARRRAIFETPFTEAEEAAEEAESYAEEDEDEGAGDAAERFRAP